MTRTTLLALVAAAALAGCNQNNTIGGNSDADKNEAAANAGVQLPPSIAASKTYRCADNSLVYIDWMSDGSAHVKAKKDEPATLVAAGSPDLKGDATAAAITFKGQSCKA